MLIMHAFLLLPWIHVGILGVQGTPCVDSGVIPYMCRWRKGGRDRKRERGGEGREGGRERERERGGDREKKRGGVNAHLFDCFVIIVHHFKAAVYTVP